MWFKTFLMSFFSFGTFLGITNIGKERKIITPFAGAIIALIQCLIIVGIWYYL